MEEQHPFRTHIAFGGGNSGIYLNADHGEVVERITDAEGAGVNFIAFDALAPDKTATTVWVRLSSIYGVNNTAPGPDPSTPREQPISLEQMLAAGVPVAG